MKGGEVPVEEASEMKTSREVSLRFLPVFLAALLTVSAVMAGPVSAPEVPADLEGVILDSVPVEWGNLVTPVPTEVPDLYVVIAQPYMALDPRAESFRARWENRDVDPTNPAMVAEMLRDPDLQGGTVLLVSLWSVAAGRTRLLGCVDVRIVGGRHVPGDPWTTIPSAFDRAIADWRAALRRRIRAGRRLRDQALAGQIAWYGTLAQDRSVLQLWLDQLMGPGEDCSKSVSSMAGCESCCDGEYFLKRTACRGAGALTALGVWFISAACGPGQPVCATVAGTFAVSTVMGECLRSVDQQTRQCTTACGKSLETKDLF